MPAFADETIQRFEIFAHALGLLRHGVHEPGAALVDDAVEGRDLLAQPIVHIARSVRRSGRRVAGERGEAFVDLRRLVGHSGQRLRCRRFDLRLGDGALGRDRADEATRRFVEQGLERAVLGIDRAAQLGLAGVELLAPARGRGVEDRGGVFGAIPDQRGQSFARPGQPVFQDLTAHDDGVVKAVGGVVEAHDEAVAMDDDGVGEPCAAGLEPLDERIRSDAEVADDCIGRLAEPVGDQVALGADRLDGLSAARADAADHIVRIGVDGVARRRRGSESRSATKSPWTRIASTASAPLELTRPTTSSA